MKFFDFFIYFFSFLLISNMLDKVYGLYKGEKPPRNIESKHIDGYDSDIKYSYYGVETLPANPPNESMHDMSPATDRTISLDPVMLEIPVKLQNESMHDNNAEIYETIRLFPVIKISLGNSQNALIHDMNPATNRTINLDPVIVTISKSTTNSNINQNHIASRIGIDEKNKTINEANNNVYKKTKQDDFEYNASILPFNFSNNKYYPFVHNNETFFARADCSIYVLDENDSKEIFSHFFSSSEYDHLSYLAHKCDVFIKNEENILNFGLILVDSARNYPKNYPNKALASQKHECIHKKVYKRRNNRRYQKRFINFLIFKIIKDFEEYKMDVYEQIQERRGFSQYLDESRKEIIFIIDKSNIEFTARQWMAMCNKRKDCFLNNEMQVTENDFIKLINLMSPVGYSNDLNWTKEKNRTLTIVSIRQHCLENNNIIRGSLSSHHFFVRGYV
ncbi:hypothetical protein EDEG_02383 [Edhazardia aedis USNM 41457]|uniref:Uncharacterized protein n=1 Tax=Edhazardia aedis (strain USNM 41457) TaxID=1003232 RepID=J9D645_EDHAE|nr:hypothetical protein EDEG_02383 [Edhazardia aedis USNM 41457]|eukprot:EJW03261.1 hypothetical protein EDEG_02383 [Edhazardia aedis USNM 41457]